MRIIVEVGHPAQIHLFKNMIRLLLKDGHQVKIASASKDVMVDLLNTYGFDYSTLYNNVPGGKLKKLGMLLSGEIAMYKMARTFRPDLFISATSEVSGPISRIFRRSHIGVTDTEHADLTNMIAYPTSDCILTPVSFKNDLGKKHVRFDGCKELAYLHPRYFKPDPSVLDDMGLSETDNFFILRLAAFNATHDAKSEKFSSDYLPELINKLKSKGEIIISSEIPLDSTLKKYQRRMPPAKYHDLLYYSKLYVGEGSSSAHEAAILGVPALHFERVNSNGEVYGAASVNGIIAEFQDKYQLVHSFYEESALLAKLDELLIDIGGSKEQWADKRERFLKDKIDVTAFLTWFVNNYPQSFNDTKQNPGLPQQKFKTIA